jgi:hypothetical protein
VLIAPLTLPGRRPIIAGHAPKHPRFARGFAFRMTCPLRCRCGSIEGLVESPRVAARAVCYCRDCQAFARFLGSPERVLNAHGGTDIIATLPRHVRFTRGIDRLACMSLSDKGLLRWYAACCRTPIGNTPRDPKIAYVGLVRACLPATDEDVDAAFGPAKIALNTQSASGHVSSTPIALAYGIAKILRNLLGARLGRRGSESPFFRPGTAEPIVPPQVVSLAERRALTPATGRG